ncbi:hypothetical protein Tco_0477208 [Tanacetum coccineum]
MDLAKAGANRCLQINELDELRLDAYESSISYKERTKRWHNKRIKRLTKYEKGNKVLFFNLRLRLFLGKVKSRWYGPFAVSKDMKNGAIKLYDEDGNKFIVNKQRVKPYQKDALIVDKDDDITLADEREVTFYKIGLDGSILTEESAFMADGTSYKVKKVDFSKWLVLTREGLGGGGFVVLGGKSSRESKNACGEVGGVEKMSSTGSKFMVKGEESLKGCVGADGGEVNRGGDDFGVSKSLLGEIPRVAIRESGGETFGVDGGTVR